MKYKVAVVGATGNVGREVLTVLAERRFPISEVVALASQSSLGKEVSFGDDKTLKIQALEHYDFKGTDFAFFCVDSKVSKIYAPKAAGAGTLVVDKSSLFRQEQDVPLIVPEVNGHILSEGISRNIIANPNCVAIPLCLALKPLHDMAPIKRVVLSTYQSVSGAGQKAMDELFHQTKSVYVNQDHEPEEFTKPIAFNVIPHIDTFNADGVTGEEEKIILETQKILDPAILITATCVRVPVFIGHCISATIEFDGPITPHQARRAYGLEQGVVVLDRPEEDGYITPVEIAGEDLIAISRIRTDPTVPHGLSMWIVGDNLRKGAALNAVQILETLVEQRHAKVAVKH